MLNGQWLSPTKGRYFMYGDIQRESKHGETHSFFWYSFASFLFVFSIYNCCQWRAKLQSVFGNDTWVKLDPFHAIQRFTSKIPRKGGKGSALRKLRSRLISHFKLIIRHPTDQGKTRKKPNPCEDTVEKNIKAFLEQNKLHPLIIHILPLFKKGFDVLFNSI